MCEQVNINVSETNETINIVSSEIQEVIDINVFETTEDVTLNITEEIIQVNINKVTSAEITNTSQLINDGEDGVNPFITLEDIPPVTGFVPYTGATEDVDLGEYELKAGQVTLDTTPTGTAGVGVMRWNDSDGTVDLGLKGGNVTLQIGQESVLRVVNKTATNINLLEANYQAVRVTGAQGQRLKIDLAQATNDNLSAETIGLVTETINNNQEGFITTGGIVRGINTTGSLQGETWADGDILYLSPTTAGNATNVKPTAPNHLVILGYVVHAHANQGSIFVKVDNGYELDELHNVKITSAANNNVLAYTSATDIWENKTVETALGYTPFQLPALTSGSVLFSNGTTIAQKNASFFWDNTNNRLGIGTATPTSKIHIFTNAIGVTQLDANGLLLRNTTAATSILNQNSPPIVLSGNAWKLNAPAESRESSWRISSTPINGTTNIEHKLQFEIGSNTTGVYNSTGAYIYVDRFNNTTIYSQGLNAQSLTGLTSLIIGKSNPANVAEQLSITGTLNVTAGNYSAILNSAGANPTSGTLSYSGYTYNGTINQTGGANGITRGLYINPTLTSAFDFRAIEVANGVTVLAPSVTARASLRIPSGTAPTSPVNGDIWFDGTDLKIRVAGVTRTIVLL